MSDEDAKIIIRLLEDIRKLLHQTLYVHVGADWDDREFFDANSIPAQRMFAEDDKHIEQLTGEVLATFEKFEKATGKSVEGFIWKYAEKGEPFHRREIVFDLKELTWPFNANAKPPIGKRKDFGGLVV